MINRLYIALRWRLFFLFNKIIFKEFGKKSVIISSLKVEGYDKIEIGENVYVGYKSWIAAVPINSGECELKIGSGSRIGNFNHIYATESIIIGENVLTADHVYISDNLHNYNDILVPILKQSIKQIETVNIGDGTWLGENVCVLGVKIGKNCVVGANSVVTKDIPDYSVAVGAPAKIIKRYCLENKEWLKTDKDGNFIKE